MKRLICGMRAMSAKGSMQTSSHLIENMIGRLEEWRRVATIYNRCPVIFLSATTLAVTVMFWL